MMSWSVVLLATLLAVLLSPSLASRERPTIPELLDSLPASHASHFRRLTSRHGIPSHHRPSTRTPLATLSTLQPPPPPTPSSPYTFSPLSYGADPTGHTDSTAAFTALLADFLSYNQSHGHRMAQGFVDLGGAVIDLQGGDYLISQPIHIPPCYGNARIQSGSLRASPSFPPSKYLIIIGNDTSHVSTPPAPYPSFHPTATSPGLQSPASRSNPFLSAPDPAGCVDNGQGVFMEDIQLLSLLLDGQHVAAGGVLITYIMGALIGAQTFIIGHRRAGVTVYAGHEVVISSVWIAEYFWDNPQYNRANSTGIEIFGNDHIVQNAIVFNGAYGMHIVGAANLIYGAHTWNKNTGDGGVGIWMDCAGYTQNRVIGSYLDGNHLIAVAPEHLVVNECFFLGYAAVVLRSQGNTSEINGLTILSNEWDGGNGNVAGYIIADERAGNFTRMVDTFVDQNMVGGGYRTGTTHLTLSLALNGTKGRTCYDLRGHLLFAHFPIRYVQLTTMGPAAGVALTELGQGGDERWVCVEVTTTVEGVAWLEVDQSEKTGQATIHATASADSGVVQGAVQSLSHAAAQRRAGSWRI